jgi:hypothetical protein
MPTLAPAQQLYAYNTSAKIGDALAARIKDPLWFLARQWQTGEFEAENGGRPAVLSITSHEIAIDTIDRAGTVEATPAAVPLDFAIEREDDDGASSVWKTEALEYAFGVKGGGTELTAPEYHGRNLDWYHFDVSRRSIPREAPPGAETRMVPTAMTFRGAPHPRWWRFEDGDAYFDSPQDPEPNILSMLLPEFFYLDINNWYVAPLMQTAGTIRQITRLTVVDSFGVATDIGPSTGQGDPEWAMFSLAPADEQAPRDGGGAFLYVPNIAIEVLDNDEVEEVLFIRDEEANLVWATERLITLGDGTQIRNGDDSGPAAREPTTETRPQFRLRSDVPGYFVPYVPRFLELSATSGEIYLRRARTVEAASLAAPQYRSRVVAESWRLDEAEVPRTGVRVRRTRRYARGSDGNGYFWIGRHKQTAPRTQAPGLRFDFLEEPPA